MYINDIKIVDNSNDIEYFSTEYHPSLNELKKNTQREIELCIEENDIPADKYFIEQTITESANINSENEEYVDHDEGTIIIKDDKSFTIIFD